ncbi:aquaporin-like protein [Reticulomyxa filosa]|uniref:Aquaporin-like protein n=1 Tax=Reticulomyxa filosa TaxID=46433 RepID=X6MT49_RETFI|nr:aquaporin-like protein [Reticulomyxa filosa]|eukprot:ETO17163.1 aquaporin-like protein [Reticulomyxa filosa]
MCCRHRQKRKPHAFGAANVLLAEASSINTRAGSTVGLEEEKEEDEEEENEWNCRESIPMYAAEFIGTMIYTMTMGTVKAEQSESNINGNSINGHASVVPLSVGFILVAMIYTFGHVSGAHFNPALNDVIMFWIVQVAAAITGMFLSFLLTNHYATLEPESYILYICIIYLKLK